uniref:Putative ovule protein n=1 Tax=Solanum chacoense TaxID=4108 RepID=A0A0V0H3S7_SOLCH
MAWRQILFSNRRLLSVPSNSVTSGFASFSSKSNPYLVKVGIPEFLNGVGKGVETHVEKLESEIGDFSKLLVTRTLKLKKLGIPCKHRKLILKYTHKYRLGLWRPRAEPVKA